jgi:hypothetical protein
MDWVESALEIADRCADRQAGKDLPIFQGNQVNGRHQADARLEGWQACNLRRNRRSIRE